jgi:hypothetical protein
MMAAYLPTVRATPWPRVRPIPPKDLPFHFVGPFLPQREELRMRCGLRLFELRTWCLSAIPFPFREGSAWAPAPFSRG